MAEFTSERTSLAIDDLVVGQQYEFITPAGRVYRGAWAGIDRHNAALDLPPGEFDLFPHGVMLVRPVRFWASCTITAMEPRGDNRDKPELASVPQSDTAVLRTTWPVVALSIAVWTAGIAWVVWKTFCS